MTAHIVPDGLTAEAVARRMLWLAWQACGGTIGNGFMQDKPSATEQQVFDNVLNRGDYPSFGQAEQAIKLKPELYADYVFGRMMKLRICIEGNTIILSDSKPTSDYQSWCRKYKHYEDLVNAAIKELRPIAPPLSPSGS